jgi:hypothetical protein
VNKKIVEKPRVKPGGLGGRCFFKKDFPPRRKTRRENQIFYLYF